MRVTVEAEETDLSGTNLWETSCNVGMEIGETVIAR